MNYTYNTVLATEGKNEDKTRNLGPSSSSAHLWGEQCKNTKDSTRPSTEMTEADRGS